MSSTLAPFVDVVYPFANNSGYTGPVRRPGEPGDSVWKLSGKTDGYCMDWFVMTWDPNGETSEFPSELELGETTGS